jgi:hypothetical protein
MERRGFLGALAAVATAPLTALAAQDKTPALRRVEILDGYVMLDAKNRVHRFQSLRADAPYWTHTFDEEGHRPEFWFSGTRQSPDDAPFVLRLQDDRFIFDAYSRDKGRERQVITFTGLSDPVAQQSIADMVAKAARRGSSLT